jgi:predicted amidohydrolase
MKPRRQRGIRPASVSRLTRSSITEDVIYNMEGGMDRVNLALVQNKTYFGRDARERNLRQAELYVAEASKRGAHFVVFPETYAGQWAAPVKWTPVAEFYGDLPWKTKPEILGGWRCDAVLRANPELLVGSEDPIANEESATKRVRQKVASNSSAVANC